MLLMASATTSVFGCASAASSSQSVRITVQAVLVARPADDPELRLGEHPAAQPPGEFVVALRHCHVLSHLGRQPMQLVPQRTEQNCAVASSHHRDTRHPYLGLFGWPYATPLPCSSQVDGTQRRGTTRRTDSAGVRGGYRRGGSPALGQWEGVKLALSGVRHEIFTSTTHEPDKVQRGARPAAPPTSSSPVSRSGTPLFTRRHRRPAASTKYTS